MSCNHNSDDEDDDKREMSEESNRNNVNTNEEEIGATQHQVATNMTDVTDASHRSLVTKPCLTAREREERRRESNRLSKRKCRGEKRDLVQLFQRQLQQLREEFKELTQENDQLRNELLECLNVKQPAAKLQKVEGKDDDPTKQDIRQAVAAATAAALSSSSAVAPTINVAATATTTAPTTSSLEYKGQLKLPPSLLPFIDTTAAAATMPLLPTIYVSSAGNQNQGARSGITLASTTAGEGGISANSYHSTTGLGVASRSIANTSNNTNLATAGTALYSLLTSLQGGDRGCNDNQNTQSHDHSNSLSLATQNNAMTHHATPSMSSSESNSLLPLNVIANRFPPISATGTAPPKMDSLLLLRKMINDSHNLAAAAAIPPGLSLSHSSDATATITATMPAITSVNSTLTMLQQQLLQQQLLQQHQHAQAQAQQEQLLQQQQKDQRELLALLLQSSSSSSSSSQQQQLPSSRWTTLSTTTVSTFPTQPLQTHSQQQHQQPHVSTKISPIGNISTTATHNSNAALDLFLQQQDLQLLSFLAGASQSSATLPVAAATSTTIPCDTQGRPSPASTLDYSD